MNTVHTPGPWHFKVFEDGSYIIADGPVDDLSSCIIASRNAHPEPSVGMANARLIAVAPELLASTQSLLKLCNDYLGPLLAGGQMTLARAAIEAAVAQTEVVNS